MIDDSYLAKDVRFMGVWLDCDLYNSYRLALPFVWGKLMCGGYIHLDEYYSLKYPGVRIAVDEFFSGKEDKPRMHGKRTMDFERWYVTKNFGD